MGQRAPLNVKTIFAKDTQYVWIRSGDYAWSSLPMSVRVALIAGLERVSVQYKSITEDSKAAWMPPVEIIPQIWGTDGASIDGRVAVVRAPDGYHLGAQLPAQVALCENTEVIRSVLVHEFCHCFHFLTESLADDPSIPGEPISLTPDGFNPFDQGDDDAILANPSEWFGERDANSLIHHDGRAGNAIHETIFRYVGHFRTVMPDLNMNFRGVLCLEEGVLKLARELRQRRAPKAAGKKGE